jgi:uncharacterized membrane protein
MVQFHPPLSGMPLAFALLALVAELMRFKASVRLKADVVRLTALTGCILTTAAAFLSGYQASNGLPDLSPEVETALGSHHAWGRMLLIDGVLLCTFAWIEKIATHGKWIFAALYYSTLVLFVTLAIYVGSLGGSLVFEHGVGVKRAADTASAKAP